MNNWFDAKHELALSTAFSLVETEQAQTDVTLERVISWRRVTLFDWLQSRWGLHWTGEQWEVSSTSENSHFHKLYWDKI